MIKRIQLFQYIRYFISIEVITSANASQLNFITIDDGARAEIQSALLQGLEVTVHESPITVNGWQGSGYSILDAEYGVGAYKISGGANGGFLILIGFVSLAILIMSGFAFGAVTGLVGAVFGYLQVRSYLSFLEELAFEKNANVRKNQLNSRVVTMVLSAITGFGFASHFTKVNGLSEFATRIWRSIAMAAYAVLSQL